MTHCVGILAESPRARYTRLLSRAIEATRFEITLSPSEHDFIAVGSCTAYAIQSRIIKKKKSEDTANQDANKKTLKEIEEIAQGKMNLKGTKWSMKIIK